MTSLIDVLGRQPGDLHVDDDDGDDDVLNLPNLSSFLTRPVSCGVRRPPGLPASEDNVKRVVVPGSPLFLFNMTDKTILGVFEADGPLGFNLVRWRTLRVMARMLP
jgi:hypothetical protein